MNMQKSELMISSPHNFLYILLKHVKACPHIKIDQSGKHYSAFMQSGYKASFTFS